jgi:hypothetical protein
MSDCARCSVTAAALIEQAGADGMNLWADGERVAYEGPAEIVERWKPRIVASKPEILAALQSASRSTWWMIHYPDGAPVEVWRDPPATQAEVLQGRPDAIAAQPLHQDAVEPITACSTCSRATYRGGCGDPVAAGLSAQDGVIVYHDDGGKNCPAWLASISGDLLELIEASTKIYGYSDDDDLELIHQAARTDPVGLRLALQSDPLLQYMRGQRIGDVMPKKR